MPEDICRKIDKSADKEEISQVVSRLQSDGVAITHDARAAIVAALDSAKLVALE